jgi:hypothetical protein
MTSVNIRQFNLKADESDIYSPEITSISDDPDTVGYGFNVTIDPIVTDNMSGVNLVKVNITFPDNTYGNYTMDKKGGDTYEFNLSDTWQNGQYNYTIWAIDNASNTNLSSQHSFNISAQATASVCTVKDSYNDNEFINITDPPIYDPPLIGYELLDEDDVLQIWNKYDSYYFNTSSGIQITNHYDEYWSHNVLMLGYYNNDQWNLIYRTDELSGFTKDIESDNETYVNATLWKNLTYQGYDFRLAIRYHLGIDDNELTVIPYIKNIDNEDIPYTLGFAWEINDIQIDMTPEDDYIEINGTTCFLNNDLNETYKNMTIPGFYIKEDISGYESESLYLRWNASLDYRVKVKSRDGQYNAPVTFAIKIGTLDVGQEKYTKMFWHDASEATYYFNGYSIGAAWETNPGYITDGNTSNYASTTVDSDIEMCQNNNCSGSDIGTISKVELRINSYYSGEVRDTILRPVFGGTTNGANYPYYTPPAAAWSPWFDITNDDNAPSSWDWSDIVNLDCDVEVGFGMLSFTLYCSQVEIRVTYTPYTPPGISNPYPSNSATNISITPMLNITVSDAAGDSMNITWLSNSSGSWTAFGWNNSASNGTYHQTMSNASVNGQWWYWKVNVTDGTNYTVSSVYRFYTGCETKIENTGSTNISGYLLMQVQYYWDELDDWFVVNDTIRENTTRTINAGEYLVLDTIFNGIVNSSNLHYWNGTYRVYAALRDPNGNTLKCDDGTLLEAKYPFVNTRSKHVGWRRLMPNGFGNPYNTCTRGIEIYNGELYVGTQNTNYTKKVNLLNDLFVDLLDEQFNSAQQYNDFLTSFLENQSIDWESNVSEVEFEKINSTIALIQDNESNISSAGDLQEFADVMISIFENQNISQYEDENNSFMVLESFGFEYNFLLAPFSLFGKSIQFLLSELSDGCDIWKYNFANNEWTKLIGTGCEIGPGFDDTHNMCASVMKEFDGKLYVGTWRAPKFNGCEVWRYDGSDWEKVVGDDVVKHKGGFDDKNNAGAWSIEEFDGSLYIGTLNANTGSDGFCQIWRSANGVDWTQVVDKGFRPDGAGSRVHNVYCWRMEEYEYGGNEYLFAGTFNAKLKDTSDAGCQLFKSPSGDSGDWSIVPLPVNAQQSEFANGFGEAENWGIRMLKDWGIRMLKVYKEWLYVGTATSLVQDDQEDIEALEIWRFNGSDWIPVIGDDVPEPREDWEEDGFGDTKNKYAFSESVTNNNKLWVGTFNGRWTIGCEVWRYDGTDCDAIVDNDDGEIPNGFDDYLNSGARSMIEYPENSNKIIVGTFRGSFQALLFLWADRRWDAGEGIGGCEVWMRYGGPS